MKQLSIRSNTNITKGSCTLNYSINNTSIKPAVSDGGSEVNPGNWLNKTSLQCTSNNDIPIKIPDYTYALINRCFLCNCELEVEESRNKIKI